MKKLFTIACTLALGCVMSFAQAASQTPAPSGTDTAKSDTTKTKKKSKKAAKKSKKDTSTTPDSSAQPK